MGIFTSDNFNIGSAYLLGDPATVGGTWTDGSATGTPSPYYDANRIRQQDALTSLTYVDTTPPSADYVVQADVTPQSGGSGGVAGVIGRKAAGTGNANLTCYWCDYYDHATAGSRTWRLYSFVANSGTSLGSYTENIGTTTKTMKLSMIGTSIKLLVDGVERISATDSSVTSAGYAGVVFGAASSPGTNAIFLDNWVASTVSSAVPFSVGARATRGLYIR